MIRAKHEGTLIGYDPAEKAWLVELTGIDERNTVTGEVVCLRTTVDDLLLVLTDMVTATPQAFATEAGTHLSNRIRKMSRRHADDE